MRDRVYVAIVFALALAIRLAPVPAAARGGLRLLSPDCYGHLRRSRSVARNFPRVPIADVYLNPPDGGVFIWPPAFDLLIGGTTRVLHGRYATLEETTRVAAAWPPLLGALHVVPLFLLARRVFGRARARLAIAAYAAMPVAVLWSGFGHADHHVAEVLVLLTFLAAAAAALPANRPSRVVLPAILVAVALFTWQGAVLVAALAFLWSVLAFGAEAPLFAAISTALVALGTAPFVLGTKIPFSFVSFGWFQPAFLALGVVAVSLLALFAAKTTRARAICLATLVLAALVVAPLTRPLVGALFRGSAHLVSENAIVGADDFADGGFLSYPKEFLALVFECQPLLGKPLGASLAASTADLSLGFLLLPFALLFWTASAFRRRRHSVARDRLLLVVLFGGVFFLMALFQRRNVYYLAVFTALALAEGLARTWIAFRRRPRALAALAVLLLVALPGLPALARAASFSGAPGHDLLDLLARLGALDPPPVDPASLPEAAPGALAGVMAPWGAGHMETALVGRPAGADPFAYGWRRQCRLYTAPTDDEAYTILRQARCKYLVTIDARSVLPGYAAAAGRPGTPLDSMFLVRVHESPSKTPAPFLDLVLTSRTGAPGRDGVVRPRFKVFRVKDVADETAGAAPR